MILVINPNSTREVTAHIDRSLESFRFADGPRIVCETLHSGPPGIETQAHVDGTSERLIAWFQDWFMKNRLITMRSTAPPSVVLPSA